MTNSSLLLVHMRRQQPLRAGAPLNGVHHIQQLGNRPTLQAYSCLLVIPSCFSLFEGNDWRCGGGGGIRFVIRGV